MNDHYIVKLGRKFNKTKEEFEFLYTKIYELVNRKSEEDVLILLYLFKPFIRKIIGSIYKQYPILMRDFLTYQDLEQQGNLFLLECIEDHNSALASFTYYMKKFVLFKFIKFISKYNSIQKHEFFLHGGSPFYEKIDFETEIMDKFMGDSFIDFCDFLSKKKTRSLYREQIIKKFFIYRYSVAELAKEYGVSYHAVYQVVNRAVYDLSNMLNRSRYSTVYIDNTCIPLDKRGYFNGEYKIRGY